MGSSEAGGEARAAVVAGTKTGGQKAAATNMELHGKDFYKRIGSLGGKATGYKGFATNPELARIAGARGGRISKRRPRVTEDN